MNLNVVPVSTLLSAGRLEMYHEREWVSVCLDGLDVFEADLVCTELGYLYAGRVDTDTVLG